VLLVAAAAALSVVLPGARVVAGPPRYTVTLFAPLPGNPFAAPYGLNERGEVVGYAALEPFHPLSVAVHVDEAGNVVGLPAGENSFNFAFGMNDSGAIAGMSERQAAVWRNGVRDLLRVPSGFFSGAAWDVNNAGLFCGNFGDSDLVGPQHCVWTSAASEPQLLRGVFAESTVGNAFAVNDSGQVAGVSGGIQGAFLAARWDSPDAEPLVLGPLEGAFNSEARGINLCGDVVGRSSFADGSIEAFFYETTSGEISGLGSLIGRRAYSEAFGVNDSLQVVGTSVAPDGRVHAFLFDVFGGGGMHDLNDLVVSVDGRIRYLSSAVAINNAGQIAAEAVVSTTDADFPRLIALLDPIGPGDGVQLPGDCNQDGRVDISDAVCLLGFLFLGSPTRLPCGDGGPTEAANQELLSWNGGPIDLSDAIALLNWAFLGGPPHVLGADCRGIRGCPVICGSE
jgi:probable HAF family extracellular repeat protein